MLLVSAAIVVAALSLPGVGEVRERLGSASRDWIVVTGVLALISMFGFARALWAASTGASRGGARSCSGSLNRVRTC